MKVRLLFGASMALLLVPAGCSSSSEGNDSTLRVLGHSLATLSRQSLVLCRWRVDLFRAVSAMP